MTVDFGRGRPALCGLSLDVPAGASLGVVGPSGSGKSTLASLLLRLHEADGGRVLIDGIDVRDYTVASLRAQQAIVLQEPVLFAASVRENIRYGRPDATDEDVERAARLARAHGFITEVLGGYDAVLGERGATLSGGQRQRLAIARAILRDPSVIILDEATTGLDPVNQRDVVRALATLCEGRTSVVISHDLDAVLDCDLVACLDQGRVVELGPPQELLARRGSALSALRTPVDGGGPVLSRDDAALVDRDPQIQGMSQLLDPDRARDRLAGAARPAWGDSVGAGRLPAVQAGNESGGRAGGADGRRGAPRVCRGRRGIAGGSWRSPCTSGRDRSATSRPSWPRTSSSWRRWAPIAH